MIPTLPHESEMTNEQRKALRRIQLLLRENFHRAMVSLIYRGNDLKLHVQIVSTCNDEREQLDMARRTLQQVEKATTGIIHTLTPEDKRIVAP